MTSRNRIIAATLSVALAMPLMAATASTAVPDGQTRTQAKVERVTEQQREHVRTEQTSRRDDDHRANRAERKDHERKERDND